ncbi:MAG: hypothetical protein HUU04_00865 [Verrucomicrobiae bacterium]|nr:hypothetical protein [Verrucomicrobiae bacterium]
MASSLVALLTRAAERRLSCLVIGGNAVGLLGFPRMTIDIDLLICDETRAAWKDVLQKLGLRLLDEVDAFIQFEPGDSGMAPVDLMIVDAATWEKLWAAARPVTVASLKAFTPRPEHLIALKLHAASSPTRRKPEADWEDIREIMRRYHLTASDPELRAMILRYGGQNALDRIESLMK